MEKSATNVAKSNEYFLELTDLFFTDLTVSFCLFFRLVNKRFALFIKRGLRLIFLKGYIPSLSI